MKWISVKDEEPPEGIKVVFLSKHLYAYPDNIYTGVRRDDEMHFANKVMFSMDKYTEPMEMITHWHMPIEDPEEKETE